VFDRLVTVTEINRQQEFWIPQTTGVSVIAHRLTCASLAVVKQLIPTIAIAHRARRKVCAVAGAL